MSDSVGERQFVVDGCPVGRRSRSGSARTSISMILPSLTVTAISENGSPPRVAMYPAAPLISAG